MRQTYLSLEILRGIFSLWVVAWHFFARIDHKFLRDLTDPKGENSSALLYAYDIFYWGSDVAVIGFFVLSGFVTSANFMRLKDQYGQSKAVGMFYAARLVRILPLTVVTVFVSVLLAYAYRATHNDWTVWGVYDDFSAWSIFSSAVGLSSHWNVPLWTLKYELIFYAALPLVLLAVVGRGGLRVLSALACIGYVYLLSGTVSNGHVFITFLLGVVAFFVFQKTGLIAGLARSINFPAVAGLLLVLLAGLMVWNARNGLHFTVPTFFVLALFICAAAGSESAIVRGSRRISALRGLSACSYSLYLWHWPVFWFSTVFMFDKLLVTNGREALQLLAVSVPILAVVTWASWYFIERHARLSKVSWRPLGSRKPVPS